MNMKDMRVTCIQVKNRFKNSDKKLNAELNKLINFVSDSSLFDGKKRKTKTLIRSFMVKQK